MKNRNNNLLAYIIVLLFVIIGIAIGFAITADPNENNSQVITKDTLKYSQVVEVVNDGKCEFVVYQSDDEQKIVHLPDCRGCK